MELTGKVIIFDKEEEAKQWFEAIIEVNKRNAIDLFKRDMERHIEASKKID